MGFSICIGTSTHSPLNHKSTWWSGSEEGCEGNFQNKLRVRLQTIQAQWVDRQSLCFYLSIHQSCIVFKILTGPKLLSIIEMIHCWLGSGLEKGGWSSGPRPTRQAPSGLPRCVLWRWRCYSVLQNSTRCIVPFWIDHKSLFQSRAPGSNV